MKPYLILAALLSLLSPIHSEPLLVQPPAATSSKLSVSDRLLARAFKQQKTGFMVLFRGTVVANLSDDTVGSRHQRFIVRVKSAQTLLIAHNIDLAPRVEPLNPADRVTIHGEYVWNSEGGIIHQTHRNPAGSAPGGWIRRSGVTFQ